MKKPFTKHNIATLAIAAATFGLAGATLMTNSASALVDTPWGPDRKTFTWDDPAPYAPFKPIRPQTRLFLRAGDFSLDGSGQKSAGAGPAAADSLGSGIVRRRRRPDGALPRPEHPRGNGGQGPCPPVRQGQLLCRRRI